MKPTNRILPVLSAIALLSLAATACGSSGGGANSGSNSEIRIAASLPFSGPAAAAGQQAFGAQAYFNYINAHGGVKMGNGKKLKISYKYLDDAYDPAHTVSNIHQLVATFKPSILMPLYGTANIAAVTAYICSAKIPTLYFNSGGSQWLNTVKKCPYLMSNSPSYGFEMKATVDYINKLVPGGAKIAILRTNDSYGQDILSGTMAAIKGTNARIVADQTYDSSSSDVSSQVALLSHSGANAWINETVGTAVASALTSATSLGWKVPDFIGFGLANGATLDPAGSAANGIYATLYEEDPSAAQWKNLPETKTMNSISKKYAPANSQRTSSFFYFGMSDAFETVKVLENAKSLSGSDIMKAAGTFDKVQVPFYSQPISTTPSYPYQVTSLDVWRYNSGVWKVVTGPVKADTGNG
jgi:branched-chain amino acid transport system substrate-binding protein